ncbi:CsbD family protein [Sphingomonas sp. GCM10030256]|uniref:CsbD family protein n=1 Tax=Sphingomonas sp. GCM10030256 TaxID=3273427 RepID=UPI00360E62A7
MNIDTLAGEGTQIKGRFKSSLGDATGDPALQQDGAVDQVSGGVRKGVGAVRDFARRQPVATAAAAALFGFGLLKSLRGRGARI